MILPYCSFYYVRRGARGLCGAAMRCSFRKVSSRQLATPTDRPGPNDDDKRSGVTFIVTAKTGGQGLVFAFVSLAHLYSFCMMLSIHDTQVVAMTIRRPVVSTYVAKKNTPSLAICLKTAIAGSRIAHGFGWLSYPHRERKNSKEPWWKLLCKMLH